MIIFIANQFVGEKVSTGGDVLFVEIARRVRENLVVLAPAQIHSEISKVLSHGSLIDTDNFKIRSESASSISGGALTVLHYLIRSWSTTIWLFKNAGVDDTIYLTGDFICNTLPAWIFKKKNKNVKVLANFYHRNPQTKTRQGSNYIVSYFSRLLQGISLKIIKQIAEKVFVLSKVGREELLKEGFPHSQIVVSGAGVNLVKQKNPPAKKKNQIVFIGRMNVTKGAFDLIEIFHLVNNINKGLKLVMIGGSSEADLNKLNGLIRQYQLEGKVNYLGFVSEVIKNQTLSESKILVLPSREEGFGIVLMEALALNTPVVCYDLPALQSIFSKYKSVNFVKSFEKIAFADKILKMVTKIGGETKEKVRIWIDVFKVQSRYF